MILFYLSVLLAIYHWVAIWRQDQRGALITKPLMMMCLIAWVVVYGDLLARLAEPATRSLGWFALGLVFGLAGDVLLELPPAKGFRAGLFSFLIGQLCYILGFGRLVPKGSSTEANLILEICILIFVIWIARCLLVSMKGTHHEGLRLPVMIYTVVISLMLYAAATTLFDPAWSMPAAGIVAAGALLFYISDAMNAWSLFIKPFENHRLWIMVTYHLAQLGIAAGVVMHFVG
jgi:alkenylglycerophosphocholine/alkenylglycerophosphoethanolamine hydrolase